VEDIKLKIKFAKIEAALLYSLLGLGFILAFYQYYFNRSLWLDEAFLANNIIKKSWLELAGTLDYNQASPLLYTFILKLFGSFFYYGDNILRLPSFIAYALGLVLIKKYLDRAHANISTQLIIFSLIVLNPYFIRYSSELKQYMMDFLAAGVYLLLAQKPLNSLRNGRISAALLLFFCFLSHAAILLTISFTILHFLNYFKNRKSAQFDIVFYAIITAGFILIYFTQFANNSNKDFLFQYWTNAGAFLPIGSGLGAIVNFLVQKYKMVCFDMFAMVPKLDVFGFYAAILSLIGYFMVKHRTKLLIFVLPLLVHLAVSGFGVYPFEKRCVLYLVVLTIIGIAVGLQYLVQAQLNKKYNYLIVLPFILLVGLISVGFSKISYPIEVEELKPLLLKLGQVKKEEDTVLVYYFSQPIVEFYQLSEGLLKDLRYTTIIENRANPENYEKSFAALGNSGWVLLSHIYPGEKEFILTILGNKGMKVNTVETTKSCLLLRYQKI
jgi:hypothetical protein